MVVASWTHLLYSLRFLTHSALDFVDDLMEVATVPLIPRTVDFWVFAIATAYFYTKEPFPHCAQQTLSNEEKQQWAQTNKSWYLPFKQHLAENSKRLLQIIFFFLASSPAVAQPATVKLACLLASTALCQPTPQLHTTNTNRQWASQTHQERIYWSQDCKRTPSYL